MSNVSSLLSDTQKVAIDFIKSTKPNHVIVIITDEYGNVAGMLPKDASKAEIIGWLEMFKLVTMDEL